MVCAFLKDAGLAKPTDVVVAQTHDVLFHYLGVQFGDVFDSDACESLRVVFEKSTLELAPIALQWTTARGRMCLLNRPDMSLEQDGRAWVVYEPFLPDIESSVDIVANPSDVEEVLDWRYLRLCEATVLDKG